MWTDPGNICINRSQTHACGNFWTEAAQFPEKEYINGIFLAVGQDPAEQEVKFKDH